MAGCSESWRATRCRFAALCDQSSSIERKGGRERTRAVLNANLFHWIESSNGWTGWWRLPCHDSLTWIIYSIVREPPTLKASRWLSTFATQILQTQLTIDFPLYRRISLPYVTFYKNFFFFFVRQIGSFRWYKC